MTPARWVQLKEIFHTAMELQPVERRAFLLERCGGDAEMLRELERLMESHDEAGDFIEQPALAPASEILPTDASSVWAGQKIGQYRVEREIGRGGMGLVLLGVRDDDQFKKSVAIKILRRGMDTEDILRRFRNERQILASLEHPNIARLLDGGMTEDGLPYFVMEYIEGEPLDKYAYQHELSVGQRLELFRMVCGAVEYAHQHLVVHRDLKPSNILVTTEGMPKLLDFGIAKLLDQDSSTQPAEATVTALRAMTPEYASPEQVRGKHITTASDIYSLGVILYELLTGMRPYNLKDTSPEEMLRVICDSEPGRPSEAVNTEQSLIERRTTGDGHRADPQSALLNPKSLKGDLDNIVLMALRKDPARRYRSVGQFSEDIKRYLEGLPVIARKDTFSYRAAKFVRRHRIGVAAATLIALTVLASAIVALRQAHRAQVQRARAERRFNELRRLSHSLMFEIHDSVQNLQGSTPTRQLIVSRALEYLDSLAQESGDDDPSLQRELATAYEKIGDIQGNPFSANLGDTDGALKSYQKAIAIREALSTVAATTDTQMEMGRSYRSLGDILMLKGDLAETVKYYRRSLAIFEQLAATHPTDAAVQDELARANEVLGDGLSRASDGAAESLQVYNKALELRQRLTAQNPSDAKLRRSLAVALMKAAGASTTDKTETINKIRQAITILEELAAADPNNARARREVGYAYFQLGNVQVDAGDYAGALESRRRAFNIRQEIATQDPKNAQAQFDLAATYGGLSEAFVNTGEPAQAVETARTALTIFEQLMAADPTNAVYQRNAGLGYERLGEGLAKEAADGQTPAHQRRMLWSEARSSYQKAMNVFLDLRNGGNIMPVDADKPERFSSKIAECEEAIKKIDQSAAH